MKKLLLNTFCTIFVSITGLSAQNQCSKKHFVFGSDIVQYSFGTSTVRSYSGGNPVDTGKNTFSNVSYGLNVWVGYFVSNKVCVGLDYNFVQSPFEYYLYPYTYAYSPAISLFPSNLFFRYYMVRADSGGFFDLALEGNAGATYTSSQNTSSEGNNFNSASVTNVTDFLSLNTGVNLLASFHISRHFALQLMSGIKVYYDSFNYVSSSITPPVPNFNFTPEKISYLTDMFTGSFRLQFYL